MFQSKLLSSKAKNPYAAYASSCETCKTKTEQGRKFCQRCAYQKNGWFSFFPFLGVCIADCDSLSYVREESRGQVVERGPCCSGAEVYFEVIILFIVSLDLGLDGWYGMEFRFGGKNEN